MEISLNQIGKRYNFNWIFKGVSFDIASGERIVIRGLNGSGKSTLLQVLAASSLPSEGKITWKLGAENISNEHIYRHISVAAPYLELIEEFTLAELINFHFSIKSPVNSLTERDILELTGLGLVANRRLSYFSSGMKQRVRLALAILSDVPLLLLDEPLSNLDRKATPWYLELIERYASGKTIVVCSNNVEAEYQFCGRSFEMEQFKG